MWFVGDPDKLSPSSRDEIDKAMKEDRILISSVGSWEIAMPVSRKPLRLTMDVLDWIAYWERLPFFEFIPADNKNGQHRTGRALLGHRANDRGTSGECGTWLRNRRTESFSGFCQAAFSQIFRLHASRRRGSALSANPAGPWRDADMFFHPLAAARVSSRWRISRSM